MNAIPKDVCEVCGEFLPHTCAPIVIITRPRWTGKREVRIIDRDSLPAVMPPFPALQSRQEANMVQHLHGIQASYQTR